MVVVSSILSVLAPPRFAAAKISFFGCNVTVAFSEHLGFVLLAVKDFEVVLTADDR